MCLVPAKKLNRLVDVSSKDVAHLQKVLNLSLLCVLIRLVVDKHKPVLVIAEAEPSHELLDGVRVLLLDASGADDHNLVNVGEVDLDR